MKKLIVCVLAGAMAFSFAACDSSESEKAEEKTSEEQEVGLTEAEESRDAEEGSGQEAEEAEENETEETGKSETEEAQEQPVGEDADADKEEAEETGEETEKQETAEEEDVPDVSSAEEGTETSESEAVPLGTWVKTAMYAAQDETFHTVYVRLTKVTTESADAAYVDSAIETNDTFGEEEDAFDKDALEVPEDGELVVLDYEVYVPEDFPAASYGMPEPRLYFSIRNIGGGGIPSKDGSDSYVGLGTTVDLIVQDPEEVCQPGHVYKERCVFAMVNGYTDYVAVYSSYPDGTKGEETGTDNLYTVYHAVK